MKKDNDEHIEKFYREWAKRFDLKKHLLLLYELQNPPFRMVKIQKNNEEKT